MATNGVASHFTFGLFESSKEFSFSLSEYAINHKNFHDHWILNCLHPPPIYQNYYQTFISVGMIPPFNFTALNMKNGSFEMFNVLFD